ncbi:MAG TPA: HEAT repeat domain-containing protein [Candidatus Angelobacter sp.]|nr:HEAT repeat domain-containing protein [Candidatus Angelobacter sp.]
MNRRLLLIVMSFAVIPSAAHQLRAQNPPASSFAEPEQVNSREDDLYNQGYEALANGNYDEAIAKFDQVIQLRGRKADAALFRKAEAQKKTGNKSQALATIAELRKAYPQSSWKKQADQLEVELSGTTNPEGLPTKGEKMEAFMALMNSDPDRGLAIAKSWLQGNSPMSTTDKDKVLFILATHGNEKAQEVLLSVANTSNDPDLQKRAIKYVGMTGNSRSRAALKEIYQSSTNVDVKKSVFNAWLMCGCKEEVLAVAKTERSPELQREAVRHLGMMGGKEELRVLYKNSTDVETREAIIHGMMLCGDSQGLAEIAGTEKDPKLLEAAIHTLGMVGGSETLTALTNIYNSHSDVATKKLVIHALFLRGAAKEMVALARKETNPELRKEWMHRLSMMSSPEITEYMMELLNK